MTRQYIEMTREETAIYDSDEQAWKSRTRAAVYARAQQLADEIERAVEVYTADGVVIEQIHPAEAPQ